MSVKRQLFRVRAFVVDHLCDRVGKIRDKRSRKQHHTDKHADNTHHGKRFHVPAFFKRKVDVVGHYNAHRIEQRLEKSHFFRAGNVECAYHKRANHHKKQVKHDYRA